eukprot:2793778-Pyramimonas_sp.AAC.1
MLDVNASRGLVPPTAANACLGEMSQDLEVVGGPSPAQRARLVPIRVGPNELDQSPEGTAEAARTAGAQL